jgi:hypothetical protein
MSILRRGDSQTWNSTSNIWKFIAPVNYSLETSHLIGITELIVPYRFILTPQMIFNCLLHLCIAI